MTGQNFIKFMPLKMFLGWFIKVVFMVMGTEIASIPTEFFKVNVSYMYIQYIEIKRKNCVYEHNQHEKSLKCLETCKIHHKRV